MQSESIMSYFGNSIPLTLKDVVFTSNSQINNSNVFSGISGVNIYVDRKLFVTFCYGKLFYI